MRHLFKNFIYTAHITRSRCIQWLGRYFQLGEMCFAAGLQFSHAAAMGLAAVVLRGQLWFHGLLSIHGPYIGSRFL